MVERIAISLDRGLLARFDALTSRRGYANRSEAVRDLIRDALIRQQWELGEGEAMGVALVVYDHEVLDLARRLADRQHRHYGAVVATLHVHVDRRNCLEVIVLRGKPRRIEKLAGALIGANGVKHGVFIPTTTGKGLD